jgi:hypothetical protein
MAAQTTTKIIWSITIRTLGKLDKKNLGNSKKILEMSLQIEKQKKIDFLSISKKYLWENEVIKN